MLQLRRIIQLNEGGYSNRSISKKLHIARDTVNSYVNRIKDCGKAGKDLLKLDDEQLSLLIREAQLDPILDDRYIDLQNRMEYFADQLKNPKTTKQILWEES